MQSDIDKIILQIYTVENWPRKAAEKCTPCVLELGQGPFIVCDDAGLNDVFALLVRGCYQNAGQNCIGVESFCPRNLYEEFLRG